MPPNRILAAIAGLFLSTGLARAAPPTFLNYSGFLYDAAGTPLSGVKNFHFTFFPQLNGGAQIGSGESLVSTAVGTDGYFSVVIDVGPLADDPLFRSQLYMAVRVEPDGVAMTPRIQVTSVPSALSVPYAGITGFPTTPCPGGQFVTGYDVNGNLACASQAGVASVTQGAGITVGGTPSSPTVSANLAPAGGENGTGTTIARGDHLHDVRYARSGALSAAGTLNDNQNPVDWTKLKGVPAGFADGVDDVGLTAVSVASGLTGDGSSAAPLRLPACASAGYALKWNGTAYECQPDTATTYTSGAGLALTGTTFTIASGGVTAAMLAPASVGAAALADAAVTVAKLADGSVTAGKLADGAVTPTAFAPGAVTSTAIAEGAVFFDKLARNGCAANQVPRWDGTAWSCSLLVDTSGCSSGQVLKWTGIGFGCQADSVNAGTLTQIATGAGLTGGPITTAGTIAIQNLGVTTGMLQDGAVTLAKLGACTAGDQVLKWSGTAWTCGADADTTYTNGAGLTLSGGAFSIGSGAITPSMLQGGAVTAAALAANSVGTFALANGSVTLAKLSGTGCLDGQVPRFDGTSWSCGAGVSQVTVQAPLQLVPGSTPATPALGITRASSLEPGYLTSTAFGYFAGKLDAVSVSAPLTGSGTGASPLGLADSGVVAGTYNMSATALTPFTVDAQGRVTGVGAPVTVAPAWSSVTGTPTTLAGYGISDAVRLLRPGDSGAQTGNVSISGAVAATHLLGDLEANNVSATRLYGTLFGSATSAETAGTAHFVDPGAITPSSLAPIGTTPPGAVPAAASDGTDTFTWVRPVTGLDPGPGTYVAYLPDGHLEVGAEYAGIGSVWGTATSVARSDHVHDFRYAATIRIPTSTTFMIGTSTTDCSAPGEWRAEIRFPAETPGGAGGHYRTMQTRRVFPISSSACQTYYLNATHLSDNPNSKATLYFTNVTALHVSSSGVSRFAWGNSGASTAITRSSSTTIPPTCVTHPAASVTICPSSPDGAVVVDANFQASWSFL